MSFYIFILLRLWNFFDVYNTSLIRVDIISVLRRWCGGYYKFTISVKYHVFHTPTYTHLPIYSVGTRNISLYTHFIFRPFLPLMPLLMRHGDARVASLRACSLSTLQRSYSHCRRAGRSARFLAKRASIVRVTHPVVARISWVTTVTKRNAKFGSARQCEESPFVGAMRREYPLDVDFTRAVSTPVPAADAAAVAAALLHPLAPTAACLAMSRKISLLSWPRWALKEKGFFL